MDWSIQEIARLAGTTSRTLRHYDSVGLLHPSRIGTNGYRYYDQAALIRLQRILLLRELGLGIPAIAELLNGQTDDATALRSHLRWLKSEQERLDRQIASVERTITNLTEGAPIMAKDMFDGFDHEQYQEEVEERWGAAAWESGDRWWRGLSEDEKRDFRQTHLDIAADYVRAREAGADPADADVQAIVARHYAWIILGWQGRRPKADEFTGLGDMYVADERFAANYGGTTGAEFVRDAMLVYALEHLT